LVFRTGRPARLDHYDTPSSYIRTMIEQLGIKSSVGAPIVVEGDLWGVMIASSKDPEPLPADTESRIAAFTELVATAVSNTEARSEVTRLAEEQAALRRVATLVARQASPDDVFAKVAQEVALLLGADGATMARNERDGTVTVAAAWGELVESFPVGRQMTLEGESVTAAVLRTSRPARLDDYSTATGTVGNTAREAGFRSAVGSPIVVDGRLWGAIIAASRAPTPMPAGAELRLGDFTELVATAISNVQTRTEVQRLADEQAALRRVATVVARQGSPADVFARVAEEVATLLGADGATMERYESDGTITVVATWGELVSEFPVGSRLTLEGENVTSTVLRTRLPARIDDYSEPTGSVGTFMHKAGFRSAVGSPIVVEGRLWGAMIAASRRDEPMPAGAEARVGEFTELVATAISNIQARSELAASRARVVAATDDERRRVVRDLHDGAQQRLVHTVITLKLARRALERDDESAPGLMTDALEQAETAMAELRELAHGILPATLTSGGLRGAVESLAARAPLPIEVNVSPQRFPRALEATAYFVVAEALTNVAKHAEAQLARVAAEVDNGALRIEIADDGNGKADANGPGLLGLADRVASHEGVLDVVSVRGEGTMVRAMVPLR
jgi:signal transduction histidine kinase